MPAPAKKIGGYQILEEIGRGGMGCVYRAVDASGQIVALKVLGAHLHDNKVERDRFHREAELAKRLNHPNLIRALDYGEADGQHYFAMEFVDGESLGKHIAKSGKLREEDAIRIAVAVADGLAVAHNQGLIHRDVKPENILLTADGKVKLVDLGLAKEVDGDLTLTQPDRGLGTPIFMAPEQFRNASKADSRCDIYALGQTLYVMVTGKAPFSSGASIVDTYLKKLKSDFVPAERICPHLRLGTIRAIQQAMQPDPAHRPRDVRAFVNILLGRAGASMVGDSSASDIDIGMQSVEGVRNEINRIYAGDQPTRSDRSASGVLPLEEVLAAGWARQERLTAIEEEFDLHPWLWLDRKVLVTLAALCIAAGAALAYHFWR